MLKGKSEFFANDVYDYCAEKVFEGVDALLSMKNLKRAFLVASVGLLTTTAASGDTDQVCSHFENPGGALMATAPEIETGVSLAGVTQKFDFDAAAKTVTACVEFDPIKMFKVTMSVKKFCMNLNDPNAHPPKITVSVPGEEKPIDVTQVYGLQPMRESFAHFLHVCLAQLPPLRSDFTTASACGPDASL
jgi:hypothetical protein